MQTDSYYISGAINEIKAYNRRQIVATDTLPRTFSVYVHSLAVILLRCDWASEQGSRSAAPQRALPCCLRRPHKDPKGTEVVVRCLGHIRWPTQVAS